IRWASDPLAAMRVASVMRDRGASIRPARIHPPSRPNTSRNASTMVAARVKSRRRKEKVEPGGTRRGRNILTPPTTQPPPSNRSQELLRVSLRRTLNPGALSTLSSLARGAGCCVDAVADAGHGGDDLGFAEAFAQGRDCDAHGVRERVGVLIPSPLQQFFGA